MTARIIALVATAGVLCGTAALASPAMNMKWQVKLKDVGGIPVLYPNEKKPDGIVVTAQPGFVIRLDARGKELWRFDMGDRPTAVPAIGDLDGDGEAEIVAGTRDGNIVALSGGGRLLWRHRLGTIYDDFKAVVLADLSGDGKPEVLVADNDGWVNCLDHAGRLRWRFKIDAYRASSPAVGDVDGDGSPEVVYATDNGRVVCISADGRFRWQFRQQRNFGRSLPTIADLGSGPVVLIDSSSPPFGSCTYCIDGPTGRLKWAGSINQQGYAAVTVADIDGDGRPEVVTADKSNTIFAFRADGKPVFATHVGGHGIFFSPAVADVDGDGEMEILSGVRQNRQDGRNFFMLTPAGAIKGEYTLGSDQNTSPLVADLDGDGVLEVVTCSGPSAGIYCFTFGGPARAGAVQSGCFRGSSSLSSCHLPASAVKPPRAMPAPAGALAEPVKAYRLGTNELGLDLPNPAPGQALIEVTRTWNKQIETHVFDLTEVKEVSAALLPGDQRVDITLIDGATGGRLLTEKRMAKVEATGPGGTALDVAAIRAIVDEADAKRELAVRRAAFGRFTSALRAAGWNGPFAAWQDANPWDNVEPLAQVPSRPAVQPVIEVWTLGNEHEHAAVNLAALDGRPVTVRATLKGLEANIEFLKPAWLPAKLDGRVPDVLPGFKGSPVLDVVTGEPCQLWMHFNTKGLEPGEHEATLTLTSLERQPSRLEIKVRLTVSQVALPDEPRTRICVWRGVSPDGTGGLEDRVWEDLREHRVTVVYGPGMPAQKCNEKGELGEEPDWGKFDSSVRRLIDGGAVLFVPGFAFSGPVEQWSPAWVRALQETARRFDAHMHALGIGNERWVYYPVDEPCLTGEESVARFLSWARPVREGVPNIHIYANPAGAVTTDFLKRMSPYCDVWCPELSIVKTGPQEWLDIMRGEGRQIWSYEAPGDVRILKPLGFYRVQPWVAARYGIDGSGYWVYSYDDLWGTGAQEPTFGAVQIEPDQSLTTTRRWEATRDGIEDAGLLHMLSDAIAAAEKRGADVSAARKLRKEALDAIAAQQDKIDAFSRFIIDYEMDFAAVQRYRRLLAEAVVSLRT